jgi:geranylgeranyl diphosphate synthase, type I
MTEGSIKSDSMITKMTSWTGEQISVAMRAAFPAPENQLIHEYYAMMEYHLGWRNEELLPATADVGKLMRPQLALLACRLLGGDPAHALPLAAALQLLHDFSLIHDDIEDHSPRRRGRPTLWSIWGLEIGINVGDGMFALAHRALYRLSDAGVAPQTVLAILPRFEETILRICEGQHLDMTGEGRFDVDEARYLTMIQRKTATLVAAATGLGARLATDDPSQVAAMEAFGDALGMAFQMQDDLLDIWGDPKLTGKPFASDLLQRKMSLPMIHAYQQASAADRRVIERIYRQSEVTGDDVAVLLAILDTAGSRAYVAGLAQREHDRALGALASVPVRDPAAQAELQSLVASLLNRSR